MFLVETKSGVVGEYSDLYSAFLMSTLYECMGGKCKIIMDGKELDTMNCGNAAIQEEIIDGLIGEGYDDAHASIMAKNHCVRSGMVLEPGPIQIDIETMTPTRRLEYKISAIKHAVITHHLGFMREEGTPFFEVDVFSSEKDHVVYFDTLCEAKSHVLSQT